MKIQTKKYNFNQSIKINKSVKSINFWLSVKFGILGLFLLLFPNFLHAQLYSVDIKEILVNGVAVEKQNYDDIVIADSDSLTFKYEMSEQSPKITKPYFFNAVLINNNDSSSRTSGVKELSFFNLNEGIYIVKINAFDLAGAWVSGVERINFRVNNKEAGLVKLIAKLQNDLIVADSTSKSLQLIHEQQELAVSERVYLIIIGASALAVAAIVMLIILIFKMKKQKRQTRKLLLDMDTNGTADKEAQDEIARQHDEIAHLKNQIELISHKIEDISLLNSEVTTNISTVETKNTQLDGLHKQRNVMFSDIVKGISDPTSTIKGLVELLRNYDFNAYETRDIVENIVENTRKIINMSEDIQRLAEFESDNFLLNFDTIDVGIVIKDAIDQNTAEAKRKNIALTYNISPDVTPLYLDPLKITVVLNNLIDNAVKFTNDNGKVTVNCFNKNNEAHFEVTDTGIGIDKSDLQRLYSNLQAETNLIDATSKIGLLTVKKYVEAHRGKVIVSSVLGKGSTFSFTIPYK